MQSETNEVEFPWHSETYRRGKWQQKSRETYTPDQLNQSDQILYNLSG